MSGVKEHSSTTAGDMSQTAPSSIRRWRLCRLFRCHQCLRTVRIIVSPGSIVFCPHCYGRFLHEIDFPRPRLPSDYVGLTLDPAEVSPGENAIPPTVQPEDYFMGRGLSDLIEGLTQNDRPGQPPAPASAIDAMPTVAIDEAHLAEEGSHCPVCKEDWALGEEAREMPCKHVYHSDCIVPWLQAHNSCPVCRHALPAGNPQDNDGEDDCRPMEAGEEGPRGSGVRPRRVRWNPFTLLWPLPSSNRGHNAVRRPQEMDEEGLDGNGDPQPCAGVVSVCSLHHLVALLISSLALLLLLVPLAGGHRKEAAKHSNYTFLAPAINCQTVLVLSVLVHLNPLLFAVRSSTTAICNSIPSVSSNSSEVGRGVAIIVAGLVDGITRSSF
ncbi:hypothetical protein Taro_022741 [Colocasia esculenta]|uniref:RING-type E3 ubiquitin transferase n=1 Tax=Colocasia esculenta TaxID=4460 RepID=A0A843V682_COLES|nr:hypothetical protein [Colocasia esculenta]